MPLVNTKEILTQAFEKNYAIGAFNINNMEIIQGIVSAAKDNNSAVILQTSKSALNYAGAAYLKSIVETASNESKIKIALHLDHGPDFETVKFAIENGFTSVMYDGSKYDYETNLKNTKQVVEYAHERNITVEAELGKLAGVEDDVKVSARESSYTDPDQAVDFVKKTNIDSLAVAIGTSHGAYKFKGEAKLDLDRLKLITQKLEDAGYKKFPIVLHGASSVEKKYVDMCNKYGATLSGASGVPPEMLREASKLSVCKINVDTDLRIAMTAAIRKFFVLNQDKIDPREYLGEARELIKDLVSEKIKNVFGSVNSN
jgi:fructose-bisphosphate aldolase class II